MLIDSHAHLDMPEFAEDRSEVIERALQGGLSHILTVSIDAASSRAAVALAKAYGPIFASVECHPHEAEGCDPDHLDQMSGLAQEKKVVAWGEIGLDFFRRRASTEAQMRLFKQQMALARDLGLPVIIHDREAHDDILRVLKAFGKGLGQGVIHCFSGDLDLALAFIELGYDISIPGTVTYKKADQIKDVATSVPLEHLLIETDAPFLAPVPKRGKRNEPLFVTHTATQIARLRNIPYEELAAKTTENAKRLFRIP